jgi:hypothetical protein
MVSAPASLALKPCAVSSFTWVVGFFTMSLHPFSTARWKTQLLASRPTVWFFVRGRHKTASCFPDTVPVSGFGPLCHCCA